MSVWTSLLQWALKTAKTEGQTVGLQALNDATSQLTSVLNQHAPDLAPSVAPLLQQIVSAGVAGIMTKIH